MRKLKAGDKVAAVSLSWGGPGQFPARYQAGKRELAQRFGVELVAMPNALRDEQWLYQHPEARADDLHKAFADPQYQAVFSTIGGDDSLRILPYLDDDLIKANAKIFLGYSDTTVTHLYLSHLGIPSFYGPAIMAGFAEAGGMLSYTEQSVRRALFLPENLGPIPCCEDPWINTPPDFEDDYQVPRPTHPPLPRLTLQGQQAAEGRLLGGCFEALEFCRGTPVWPTAQQWRGAVLFLEIAEAPAVTTPNKVIWFIRNLAAQGIVSDLAGIILARVGEQVPVSAYPAYEDALVKGLKEANRTDMPVISRVEFGHTDPMCVLPYGVKVRLEPKGAGIVLLEDPLNA